MLSSFGETQPVCAVLFGGDWFLFGFLLLFRSGRICSGGINGYLLYTRLLLWLLCMLFSIQISM